MTDVQNPMIRWHEEVPIGEDYFGNEIYEGDEVLEVDGGIFLKHLMPEEAIVILKEFCHAIERRAGVNGRY